MSTLKPQKNTPVNFADLYKLGSVAPLHSNHYTYFERYKTECHNLVKIPLTNQFSKDLLEHFSLAPDKNSRKFLNSVVVDFDAKTKTICLWVSNGTYLLKSKLDVEFTGGEESFRYVIPKANALISFIKSLGKGETATLELTTNHCKLISNDKTLICSLHPNDDYNTALNRFSSELDYCEVKIKLPKTEIIQFLDSKNSLKPFCLTECKEIKDAFDSLVAQLEFDATMNKMMARFMFKSNNELNSKLPYKPLEVFIEDVRNYKLGFNCGYLETCLNHIGDDVFLGAAATQTTLHMFLFNSDKSKLAILMLTDIT